MGKKWIADVRICGYRYGVIKVYYFNLSLTLFLTLTLSLNLALTLLRHSHVR